MKTAVPLFFFSPSKGADLNVWLDSTERWYVRGRDEFNAETEWRCEDRLEVPSGWYYCYIS